MEGIDISKNYIFNFDMGPGKVWLFETIKIISLDGAFICFKDKRGKTSTFRLDRLIGMEEL